VQILAEAVGVTVRGESRKSQDYRGDPALVAQDREFQERFQKFLDQLKPELRDLWDCIRSGRKLSWIAKDLGISYSTVKRRKEEFLKQLQERLAWPKGE
jgi:RNA polymerase sigma factor (sigma-70 family)